MSTRKLTPFEAELIDMLRNQMDWAAEISCEYLDGDPDVRCQYRKDRKAAHDLIAKVREA